MGDYNIRHQIEHDFSRLDLYVAETYKRWHHKSKRSEGKA
jgi:hypothetical protein